MENNWANFGNQNTAPPENNVADDEDDFGDFGGFEGAEPVASNVAEPLPQALEASVSPWAVYQPGVMGGGIQPDLIRAQTNIQQNLEPPFPTEEILNTMSQSTESFDLDKYLITGQAGSHSSLSEDTVQGSGIQNLDLAQTTNTVQLERSASGSMPLDLAGSTTPRNDKQSDSVLPLYIASDPQQRSGAMNSDLTQSNREMNFNLDDEMDRINPAQAAVNDVMQDIVTTDDSRGIAAKILEDQKSTLADAAENKEMENKITMLEQEKRNLEKDFTELMRKNHDLEKNIEDIKSQLTEQKHQYEKIQEKHSKDLDGIREAGHGALAVIVEEYKELCKLVILEQQENSEKKIADALKKKTQECEQLLKEQHERLLILLEEEKCKNEQRIKECIEQEHKSFQVQLNESIKQQQLLSQEELESSSQKQGELSQSVLEKTVQEERERTKELLEQENEKFKIVLEEEREKSKQTMEHAVTAERDKSKEVMETALKEERERSKQAVTEAQEHSRKEFQQHLKEQKQADSVLRQRSLTAIDLFLESARQQLQLVMSDNTASEESIQANSASKEN